ncbi:unnamed protein product [Schistosoma margrebowiei]|uniref:Uncharacterized protein n=1 Tax=Schistosoma margrebowiei TaxID=48269 RepID=A0A3P8EFJ0_9TREM|nr:unnamed protein product [Schistosoma margrebowiei]
MLQEHQYVDQLDQGKYCTFVQHFDTNLALKYGKSDHVPHACQCKVMIYTRGRNCLVVHLIGSFEEIGQTWNSVCKFHQFYRFVLLNICHPVTIDI